MKKPLVCSTVPVGYFECSTQWALAARIAILDATHERIPILFLEESRRFRCGPKEVVLLGCSKLSGHVVLDQLHDSG